MENYINYLESRIDEINTEIAGLEAQERRDDANFAKVRANIYSVCLTVSRVHLNRPGGGPAAVRAQLERFSSEWGASLAKAREHGDVAKEAVEETKLAVLEDVRERFEEAAAE